MNIYIKYVLWTFVISTLSYLLDRIPEDIFHKELRSPVGIATLFFPSFLCACAWYRRNLKPPTNKMSWKITFNFSAMQVMVVTLACVSLIWLDDTGTVAGYFGDLSFVLTLVGTQVIFGMLLWVLNRLAFWFGTIAMTLIFKPAT